MKVLFVHNNFPAQFRNIAASLAGTRGHVVAAIGSQTARDLPGVSLTRYDFAPMADSSVHPFARRFDIECRRAEHVLYAASAVLSDGFHPDLIMVHCGWGEALPLRQLFPTAKIIVYAELYYRPTGLDVHFDREGPVFGADGLIGLRAKNAATLLALVDADLGLSPTQWQRSSYPSELQSKIEVCHEGIDLDVVRPREDATLTLADGRILSHRDEIVTYVARDLEPVRGFHRFMRALPDLLASRPRAEVIIIGGDSLSYGNSPPDGSTWRQTLLRELAGRADLTRVHFLGRVPYEIYLAALQISSVHVYLTYPFVLSWSLLEAMATGCRIVASDTEPVREVMSESNGILVPFFEQDRLVESLAAVLSRPDTFAHLGHNARATIKARYDMNTCVDQLEGIIQRLVGTAPAIAP